MSDFDLKAGETLVLDFGPVEAVNYSTVPPTRTAINLRATDTRLRFIAKRSKDDLDADAEIAITFEPNVTEGEGITVPAVGSNNNGTITIGGALTRDIVDAKYLSWELWLHEPGGRDSVIDSGTIKVGRAARLTAP